MRCIRALQLFAAALAHVRRGSDLHDIYRFVGEAMRELVGFRLMTIQRLSVDGTQLIRVFSSDQSYPLGGCKSVGDDAWIQQILREGAPAISPDHISLRQRFPDYGAISAMGCGAALNIPAVGSTGALGSLNLLHEERWFAKQHALMAEPFAAALALAWQGNPIHMVDES